MRRDAWDACLADRHQTTRKDQSRQTGRRRQLGYPPVQGFTTARTVRSRSATLRVTSVKPCTAAVAAMKASAMEIGRPNASLDAVRRPQESATATSTGNTL